LVSGAKKQTQFKANLITFSVLRSADSVKIRKWYLKKQSQFLNGQISIIIYIERDYEDFHALRRRKNKAKQSQFPQNPAWACRRSAQTNGGGIIISFVA
jgi:hypothetical protein